MKKEYDKYSLSGDYFIAMDRVEDILRKQLIKREDRINIERDLFYIFKKGQNEKIKLDKLIGGDLEEFITEVVKSYFLNFSWKEWIFRSLETGLLTATMFSVLSLLLLGENSAIFLNFIFMIIGIVEPIFNYFVVIKLKGEYLKNIVSFMFWIVLAIGFMFLVGTDFYWDGFQVTAGFVLVEFILYLIILFRNRFKKLSLI